MIKILRQGLPVVGFAKIGGNHPKDGPKRGAPFKFDHFELTTTNKNREGHYYPDIDVILAVLRAGAPTCGGCDRSKELARLCGEPELEKGLPVSLDIVLPFDDLEANFPHKLSCYRGNTLFCTGDGETAERRKQIGKRQVKGREVAVWGPLEPYDGVCGSGCEEFDADPVRCKPTGRLRFMLREMQNMAGCYEFRSTSWNSVANIVSGLQFIQAATDGRIRWIPLRLELVPTEVQSKHGGPSSTAWVARFAWDGNRQSLLQAAHEQAKLEAPLISNLRRLEAACRRDVAIPEDEILDFREEFDHENLEAESEAPPREPVTIPDASQLPPDEAPTPEGQTLDAPDPPPQEENVPPFHPEPEPPADPEPDDSSGTISAAERLELWQSCQKRAGQFAPEANVTDAALWRSVMSAHGLKSSEFISRDLYPKLVVAINNWKP